jgi:hypothetical protein
LAPPQKKTQKKSQKKSRNKSWHGWLEITIYTTWRGLSLQQKCTTMTTGHDEPLPLELQAAVALVGIDLQVPKSASWLLNSMPKLILVRNIRVCRLL